jgi:uncharacterized protein YndB with AHSA1/START domain
MTTPPADAALHDVESRTLTITRTINAPRPLVFETWTDPKHIDHWWGPDGFTNTTYEMDVRVGGLWRYNMHGPDGTDYPNRVEYAEVVSPERLVYWHGWDKEDDPDKFHVTVTFADLGAQTDITMTTRFPTVQALLEAKEFGAVEGGQQTLSHLDEYVRGLER